MKREFETRKSKFYHEEQKRIFILLDVRRWKESFNHEKKVLSWEGSWKFFDEKRVVVACQNVSSQN